MDRDAASHPVLKVLFADHDRQWRQYRYIYPVVSRRSGGLSIGVNLNPDKVCNFDCIYCSVNRGEPPATREVDEDRLMDELAGLLDLVASGEIFTEAEFANLPPAWRRVNDIAFSGDGEPTSYGGFLSVVTRVAELKRQRGLDAVKIVLISNATLFHRPAVQQALAVMDANHGEVWAKLDAGTAEYYDRVDRTAVPFQRVLDNLLLCARQRPTVIQSLFMTVRGVGPSAAEIDAYVGRLAELVRAGGQIKLVQVYTVARWTTESYVDILDAAGLDAIATKVRAALPGTPVEVYYGVPIQRG